MTKKLVDNKIASNKAEYDKKFSHVLGVTPYHGASNLTEDNGLSLQRIKVVKG
ncbi:hypothetical protein [Rickettsia rhipicephali]|uniref:hypothetical protein n=1 Tax=Rickettsia rhipicephali TaxID=33992 RepID=UPI000AC6F32E|nr:hypothetical protein [Rickettsia rhipicephali]